MECPITVGLLQRGPSDGLISTSSLRTYPPAAAQVYLNPAAVSARRSSRFSRRLSDSVASGWNAECINSALQREVFDRIFPSHPPTQLRSAAWNDVVFRMVTELCREETNLGMFKLLQCSAITPKVLTSYIITTLTPPDGLLRGHNRFFKYIGTKEKEFFLPYEDSSRTEPVAKYASQPGPRKFIAAEVVCSIDQIPVAKYSNAIGYNLDFFEWVWKLWTYTTGICFSLVPQEELPSAKPSPPTSTTSIVYEVNRYDSLISPITALRSIAEFLRTNHDAAAACLGRFDFNFQHHRRCEFCSGDGTRNLHSSRNITSPVASFLDSSSINDEEFAGALPASFNEEHRHDHEYIIEEFLTSNGLEASQFHPLHYSALLTDHVNKVAYPPLPFKYQGLSLMSAQIEALNNYCHLRNQLNYEYYGKYPAHVDSEALLNDIVMHEILVDLLHTRKHPSEEHPTVDCMLPMLKWIRQHCELPTNTIYSFWSKLLSPATVYLVIQHWPNYLAPYPRRTVPTDSSRQQPTNFWLVHECLETEEEPPVQSTPSRFTSDSLDYIQQSWDFPAIGIRFPFRLLPQVKLLGGSKIDGESSVAEVRVCLAPTEDQLRKKRRRNTVNLLPEEDEAGRWELVKKLDDGDCPELLPSIWTELCELWMKLMESGAKMPTPLQELTSMSLHDMTDDDSLQGRELLEIPTIPKKQEATQTEQKASSLDLQSSEISEPLRRLKVERPSAQSKRPKRRPTKKLTPVIAGEELRPPWRSESAFQESAENRRIVTRVVEQQPRSKKSAKKLGSGVDMEHVK